MKKTLLVFTALMLLAVLLFSLCSCKSGEQSTLSSELSSEASQSTADSASVDLGSEDGEESSEETSESSAEVLPVDDSSEEIVDVVITPVEQWLNKETATFEGTSDVAYDWYIEEIQEDYFICGYVIPLPYQIKVHGNIGDEWCVGDKVEVKCKNLYIDNDVSRMECELVSIKQSSFVPDPDVCYKPVIYLYPEVETIVEVKLNLSGRLTCTYPTYGEGWSITASPNGTLYDDKGQSYSYLYWEGETDASWDFSRGFCIKGTDTASFLEAALAQLGLNRREANEFIVYWLPLMQENEYNIIAFQGEVYENAAQLNISPAPDTVIRVFMAYKAADSFVDIPPQELTAPKREGFTVIEWGGTEIK